VLERDGAAVRDALGKAEGWVRDREATIDLLRADIRRLQETAAAASLREEELQRLHDQLVGAREEELKRIHDELAGAREEELGRIRSQLAGLREAVMQFEREAEQRSAGDAAMRREIAVALEAARRSSDAAAQNAAREAQQSAAALESVERRASEAERKVPALSGEIEGLKTELADSRQVGRAALHALAVSNRVYAYREPRLGWRQTIQRLFGAIRGQ
jgi:chromosome segregation ATPase